VVQKRQHVVPETLRNGGWFRHLCHLHLFRPSSCGRHADFLSRPVGHAVEPAADRVTGRYRRRLADKHEEGGLEGILGVVQVRQETAAHTQHRRAVPSNQGLESGCVTCCHVAAKQLPVGEFGAGELGKRVEDGRHSVWPPVELGVYLVSPGTRGIDMEIS
jgi:hypothetical protein